MCHVPWPEPASKCTGQLSHDIVEGKSRRDHWFSHRDDRNVFVCQHVAAPCVSRGALRTEMLLVAVVFYDDVLGDPMEVATHRRMAEHARCAFSKWGNRIHVGPFEAIPTMAYWQAKE